MLYQHKETKKICDLVHSGPGYCVIIYLLKNDNILDVGIFLRIIDQVEY